MTIPHAFTVHREASGPALRWAIDDPRVELLWLPIIGPTPYCALRVFDRELGDAAEYFADHTIRMGDLADRLGVKIARAWQSLLRLERSALIVRDFERTHDDHPVFVVDRSVHPVGEAEWARLPARLRERHAGVELGGAIAP
jgi:hypothetical protein